MKQLTQERLREVISYDPETGEMYRKKCFFKKMANKPAGNVGSRGYLQLSVEGNTYPLHRIAWMYMYGKLPDGQIDHIDGNRQNNKISNLRDITQSENLQNLRSAKRSNKVGMLGVSFHAPMGKWKARIKTNGVQTHLGYFNSPEEAHKAYLAAKRDVHPFGEIAKELS